MLKKFNLFADSLSVLPPRQKLLITTLNAHSFNVTKSDALFNEVLLNSDVLIPDGISIVLALKLISGKNIKKIAGADLFFYEMERLQQQSGSCFFLGSTDKTLQLIKSKIAVEYPNVKVNYWSPPYKPQFSDEDNSIMINKINSLKPDVLFIGLTAPKQEKWAYQHLSKLEVGHICCIGAVFDFYAGTVNRAPSILIKMGLEWLYRLIMEPKRMWKRYLIGNPKFILYVLREKLLGY